MSGTVDFVPRAGGTEVELYLRGLPKPEGAYVGTIYQGNCARELGRAGGELVSYGAQRGGADYWFVHGDHGDPADEENVVQTLTSVSSSTEGTGASTTPLPISTDKLLSGEPKYVDIHGEDSRPLACANLPEGGSFNA